MSHLNFHSLYIYVYIYIINKYIYIYICIYIWSCVSWKPIIWILLQFNWLTGCHMMWYLWVGTLKTDYYQFYILSFFVTSPLFSYSSFVGIFLVHPTITFTAGWSKTSINFLDVTVSLVERVIETDSHQYLQSGSCHPFHCKKGIPYSQALRLNHNFSETNSFDKRSNNLERFLLERGYRSRLMRQEILQ